MFIKADDDDGDISIFFFIFGGSWLLDISYTLLRYSLSKLEVSYNILLLL